MRITRKRHNRVLSTELLASNEGYFILERVGCITYPFAMLSERTFRFQFPLHALILILHLVHPEELTGASINLIDHSFEMNSQTIEPELEPQSADSENHYSSSPGHTQYDFSQSKIWTKDQSVSYNIFNGSVEDHYQYLKNYISASTNSGFSSNVESNSFPISNEQNHFSTTEFSFSGPITINDNFAAQANVNDEVTLNLDIEIFDPISNELIFSLDRDIQGGNFNGQRFDVIEYPEFKLYYTITASYGGSDTSFINYSMGIIIEPKDNGAIHRLIHQQSFSWKTMNKDHFFISSSRWFSITNASSPDTRGWSFVWDNTHVVNTGTWLGKLDLYYFPYVQIYGKDRWIYIPTMPYNNSSGAWVYFYRNTVPVTRNLN